MDTFEMSTEVAEFVVCDPEVLAEHPDSEGGFDDLDFDRWEKAEAASHIETGADGTFRIRVALDELTPLESEHCGDPCSEGVLRVRSGTLCVASAGALFDDDPMAALVAEGHSLRVKPGKYALEVFAVHPLLPDPPRALRRTFLDSSGRLFTLDSHGQMALWDTRAEKALKTDAALALSSRRFSDTALPEAAVLRARIDEVGDEVVALVLGAIERAARPPLVRVPQIAVSLANERVLLGGPFGHDLHEVDLTNERPDRHHRTSTIQDVLVLDEDRWAIAEANKLRVYSPRQKRDLARMGDHRAPVHQLVRLGDNVVATLGRDGWVKTWDVHAKKKLSEAQAHASGEIVGAWHRDRLVTVGGGDGRARVWSMNAEKLAETALEMKDVAWVRCDGEDVLLATRDGHVRVLGFPNLGLRAARELKISGGRNVPLAGAHVSNGRAFLVTDLGVMVVRLSDLSPVMNKALLSPPPPKTANQLELERRLEELPDYVVKLTPKARRKARR
jgi:hypothetical protein